MTSREQDERKRPGTPKKSVSRWADCSLLLVAMIWGAGFVATEYAVNAGLKTTLILTLRFGVAAIAFLPLVLRRRRAAFSKAFVTGAGAGTVLFFAFFAQTYGQSMTTVSNAAFLTATNVIIVPFVVWGVTQKRPSLKVCALAAGTLFGVALLTLKPESGALSMNAGDGLMLLCAALFAVHIVYLGTAARGLDVGVLTFAQFATASLLSLVTMLLWDREALWTGSIAQGLGPVLFLGCLSTCACFFLQTKAQQYTPPAKAGILLSAEGLFGSVFSLALGIDAFSMRLLLGGAVVLACVVMAQWD